MTERFPSDNRLLVVLNKESTNAHRYLDKFRHPLLDTDWEKSLVEINTGSHLQHENEEYIASQIEDGDIVIGYGGDGLANTLLNAEVLAQKKDTKSIFLPGGNGNDNSLALYGRKIKKFNNILNLIEHGEVQPINTIKVVKDSGDTRHALGYVGFGLTAVAAEKIGSHANRTAKKNYDIIPDILLDGVEVIKAIHDRVPFEYISKNNNVHMYTSSMDISFFNITRAARVLKIDREAKKTMTCIESSSERFVLSNLSKFVRENFTGGLVGKEIEQIMITFETDTKVHYDGEVYPVAMHEIYNVSHHPQTLDVLAFPDRN